MSSSTGAPISSHWGQAAQIKPISPWDWVWRPARRAGKYGFTTAAALVHELIEAVDERRLQRLQKQLVSQDLLIIDELGFVPLSKTGAELLFEIISQRYERGSIIITSNLPFDEWTGVFGAERLTGAILDSISSRTLNHD